MSLPIITLGSRVRDIPTGFTGVATARVEYLAGCIQYCVAGALKPDGTIGDNHYFDVQRLEVVGEPVTLPLLVEPGRGGDYQRDAPTARGLR